MQDDKRTIVHRLKESDRAVNEARYFAYGQGLGIGGAVLLGLWLGDNPVEWWMGSMFIAVSLVLLVVSMSQRSR
jgi:hypothetical protein